MQKQDILNKLEKFSLNKNEFIVIGDASLVLQDFIDEASCIELSCSKEVYNNLNLEEKLGTFNTPIKYVQEIEVGYNLYDLNRTIMIDSYNCMDLSYCLEVKKKLNRKKDNKIIEKLDLYLCLKDNKRYEKELYNQGITLIGGVDEVGRGPLIGPVVASCVVLPKDFALEGLTDSKKLSEKKRDLFYEYIINNCIAYGIGIIDPDIIDKVNIYEASKLAMLEAIRQVREKINLEYVLTDAMNLDLDIENKAIIKGDIKSITISAASVVAKVTRDRMMYELDLKYPEYGFKNHKGYPTKKHIEAINKYGLIEGYRKTYGPVKEVLERMN